MTERFTVYLASLEKVNQFIVQMFLFALFAIAAYKALDWLPESIRRVARYAYLAALLALSIFVPVYFAWL